MPKIQKQTETAAVQTQDVHLTLERRSVSLLTYHGEEGEGQPPTLKGACELGLATMKIG